MSTSNFNSQSIKRHIFWTVFVLFFGFFIPFASFKTADIVYRRSMPINGDNQQQKFLLSEKEEKINTKFARTDLSLMTAGINDKDLVLIKRNVSLLFAGDIMVGRGVENSVIKNGNGDYAFLFKNADFVKNADISFGNLEGPISDTGKDLENLYSFRFNPLISGALKDAGFDVLSIANNHIGDWGRDAFEDNLLRLINEDFFVIGGGVNKENAAGVKIIGKQGMRFGFLAFSDVGPNWLEATRESSGILIARENEIASLVRQTAPRVDVLIVSLHFGEEYQKTANERQKKLAHLAIANGAKIVVGHHPHVIQEVEYYKNGVIAYSLGNFIFDQNFSEETMQGMVLDIIMKGKEILSVKQHQIKINDFFQPELVE